MTRSSRSRKTGAIVLLGVGLIVVAVVAIVSVMIWKIESSVREVRFAAQQAHPQPGDDVAALLQYLSSEDHSLMGRNRAVWALGQMGDERALGTLEVLFTGEECDHDRGLCQRELEKAVRNSREGPPRLFFWRRYLEN